MEKMRMESVNITAQNIDKIGALFPNCITETIDENGKPKKVINFDMLKQMLSDDVLEGDESYEFTWVGKKASIIEANNPIRKTLRPSKGESVDWNKTENLYIEGDNLEVLKLLQESYLNKVKIIYIDPPYNTGHDFIYPDSFVMNAEDYDENSGYFDDNGNINFKKENSSSAGRYHSDWCSMLYSRLLLARNLLSDDGVIFISIDDNEQSNLTKICDEIFGSENHIGTFIQNKRNSKNDTINIQKNHEYILAYRKMKILKGNSIKATLVRKAVTYKDAYTDGDDYFYLNDPITTRGEGGTLNARPNLGYTVYYNPLTKDKIAVSDYDVVMAKTSNDEDALYREDKTLIDAGYIAIRPPRVRGKLGCWTWSLEKFNNEKRQIIITGKPGSYAVRKRTFIPKDTIEEIDGKLKYRVESNTNSRSILDFSTNDGTNALTDIMESSVFNNPKNEEMLKYLIDLIDDKNCIIMDFFSGSATTAQAVIDLNATDNGCRKFIMVQVQELCEEKKDAFKAGYKNICEIGKERIRRAGQRIKEENPFTTLDLDTGFRVLKIDDSNMTDVYYNSSEYSQNLLSSLESNIKPDRTDLDLLFGCLLEWGLPLSLPYSSEEIDGCTVHDYNDGDLIACFDENVPDSVVKAIAKKQPLRAVFRDSSFSDSPSKINVGEIFKLLAPDTRVKVI